MAIENEEKLFGAKAAQRNIRGLYVVVPIVFSMVLGSLNRGVGVSKTETRKKKFTMHWVRGMGMPQRVLCCNIFFKLFENFWREDKFISQNKSHATLRVFVLFFLKIPAWVIFFLSKFHIFSKKTIFEWNFQFEKRKIYKNFKKNLV